MEAKLQLYQEIFLVKQSITKTYRIKIDLAMGVFERKLQMKACHFRLISNGNKQRNVFPATFNKDSHLHFCKGKKKQKSHNKEKQNFRGT